MEYERHKLFHECVFYGTKFLILKNKIFSLSAFIFFYLVAKAFHFFLPTDRTLCKWWVFYPVEKKKKSVIPPFICRLFGTVVCISKVYQCLFVGQKVFFWIYQLSVLLHFTECKLDEVNPNYVFLSVTLRQTNRKVLVDQAFIRECTTSGAL